ncbi:unnamed protein product [Rotaria socialis]
MLCYGCHSLIDEPYYLMIVDHSWHASCLKCIDCGMLLEHESSCFARLGQVFCKNHYMKKNCSSTCTRCHKIIQQDELIMRAERFIFHLNCFTCNICNSRLHPGDDYGLIDTQIYCLDHFLDQDSHDSHVILDDSGYHTSPNETHRSRSCQQENEESFLTVSSAVLSSSYCIEIDDDSYNKTHYTRQKRLRTSFKHHQIRCMKLYFNINHNPDAKDLKDLSEKTNLPKRVLQVWFQNARAKYRRSNTSSNEVRTNLSSLSNSDDL